VSPDGAEPAMARTWSRGITATPTGPGWQTCSDTERMSADPRYYERATAEQFGTAGYY